MNSKDLSQLGDLEQAVLKTLAYFDIFNYPLTLIEVYKWLYWPGREYQVSEVLQALSSEQLKHKISQKFGFYFLAGREENIRIRLDRYSIAEKKFHIGLRFAKWIRWLTFVKMIAVCNNVGYNNGSESSDIDYFVVVDKGRIWWSRLVITLVATALRLRRHANKVADRICLSFYIGQNHLNLSDISLKPVDPYLVYWFATLAPIFDDGTYKEFLTENSWLKSYLPNFYPTQLNSRRSVEAKNYIKVSRRIDQAVLKTFLGDILEKAAKLIQLKKIKSYLGDALDQKNTNVVISSSMLKFHKLDRREAYRLDWQKSLNKM